MNRPHRVDVGGGHFIEARIRLGAVVDTACADAVHGELGAASSCKRHKVEHLSVSTTRQMRSDEALSARSARAPRCSPASSRAKPATVGARTMVSSGRSTSPERSRSRATASAPRIESPPRAKKSSWMPIEGSPRTSDQMSAIDRSNAGRGATYRWARHGRTNVEAVGEADRWIFPVEPFGISSTTRILRGTLKGAGSLRRSPEAPARPHRPGLEHHGRRHLLAQSRVGHSEGHRLGHRRMGEQTSSISTGEIFSPPRLISSLMRP